MSTSTIRLLVVDDSIYMQMAIRAMLGKHPEIEIVGEAADGAEAIQLARELKPDVITMDVNMPGIDGLEATRQIMTETPTRIIMLSSLTEKGLSATFGAMEHGAVDYVSKSSSAIDVDLSTIAAQVVEKIMFWGQQGTVSASASDAKAPSLPADTDFLVVTGGSGSPSLIGELLQAITPLPFPVLIVQNMPPSFTAPFVEFLIHKTGHPTKEATARSTLDAGTITVLPGGREGTISRDTDGLRLDLGNSASANRVGDVIASALTTARAPVLLFLSGEARPLNHLVAAAAGKTPAVWVQKPTTCFTDALPRSVIATGLARNVFDPGSLIASVRPSKERTAA
ncbi:MAG: response regulator [Pseudolabrys sp.]|nr:response regulator [Pseudolabrys sp.]